MTQETKGLIAAVTTALSWSVLAIGLKYILFHTSSGNIAWVRMMVAAGSLLSYFLIFDRAKLKILKRPPLLVLVAGICLSANYFGFMRGIELTSASNTQIMIQMAPMSLVLIGIFYFKEIPSRFQTLGFISALVGFSFFYWDQFQLNLQSERPLLAGNLWIIMAAVTWAVFATITKVLSKRWDPQQINMMIYLISCLALYPVADIGQLTDVGPLPWVLLIGFGLNTILAYGCLGYALKNAPASKVSVILSANPLLTLAILASMAPFFEKMTATEKVTPLGYLGALLVISGVILASSSRKT